ncbi:MAG: 2-amino-4-hydroxy-6-hydroxymethyldihydropteridine diphosphokinase [Cyclobacteriaceae bacterium]|nr:2-amino-4-hydroxy-6-hydroxymethyldihydropteridine diphosphokinase [Cyclobacteriaceae bacterium]MCH8515819.1 2-amino-4-hydroxy-6-hydroxymethyldihydropteridine diphosphokinase [Cyclobacteriaceae bacterium]
MEEIYISLGSNIGDRNAHLQQAIKLLQSDPNLQIKQISAIYESSAWGLEDQAAFYNCNLSVAWNDTSSQLLDLLLDIEHSMQRKRLIKWGPRNIDIDLLYFGDEQLNTQRLILPHPHIKDRKFILMPMVEIAPDFRCPRWQLTQRELLHKCNDQGEVKKVLGVGN